MEPTRKLSIEKMGSKNSHNIRMQSFLTKGIEFPFTEIASRLKGPGCHVSSRNGRRSQQAWSSLRTGRQSCVLASIYSMKSVIYWRAVNHRLTHQYLPWNCTSRCSAT